MISEILKLQKKFILGSETLKNNEIKIPTYC